MINKKFLKLLRSQNKYNKNNFIYEIIAKRINDSLDLLKISATDILEIGINEDLTFDYIKDKFSNCKITRGDICESKFQNKKLINYLKINISNLELKKNTYDIVYSNFFLHICDNIEENLKSIFDSLKSNGLFIFVIPGSENIYQLINSMYKVDQMLYSGSYSRHNPTVSVNEIFKLLKKLRFDAPTINADKIRIEYSNFDKLLNDIKTMNLSYCYNDKRQFIENKQYFRMLKDTYENQYFKNNNYILDIDLIIITAWKK